MTLIEGAFLDDQPGPRPWSLPEGGRGGFEAADLFLGAGANPLEVVVATAAVRPNVSDVRQLWKRRKANRPSPVLLVVLYNTASRRRAAVCGPVGEDPAVQTDLDPGQVERLAIAALAEPNRNAAIRFLAEALPEAESELPGIRNQGMFAAHELRDGVPLRADWNEMAALGRRVLSERGRNLVTALGYVVDELSASASVLRIAESNTRAAVAVFLDETETPDGSADRFGGTSPVSYALEKADAERLPYVVLTRGSQIRVYATSSEVGVGRKGRAETFVEANLALLPDAGAAFVPLLFGASALRDGGTFEQILERSRDFSIGLGERLRDRVYVHVVPQLATAIAAHHAGDATEGTLADLYEQTMVVLFRLLFIAYAEDKDLLPYRQNGLYQRNALKTFARDLAELANDHGHVPEFDPNASDLWSKVTSLWRAIDKGNRDWAVPEYNGGMFSSDTDVNPAGAAIARCELANSELGPALFWLLVDADATGGFGPVDFRSLSVREFGTIYEGLLESSLAFAGTNLTVDDDGTYLPACEGQAVAVKAGDIYLHDRSGTRKATGSYFTKPFAVSHLLDHALEPTLDDHVACLADLAASGNDADAARLFFDFRVADIAMGSGHFLVAAVDHIEARLSNFLATHPIPGVLNEFERLRAAAHENLGDIAEAYEIEDASLLRRQIARRCIYGVDLNLIAVELARLAMWIHTFVPGLPLSFLDHNLVEGNSLTGIGSVDEAADALDKLSSRQTGRAGTSAFGRVRIEERLGLADEALRRLARSSDATAAEIRQARQAHIEARQAIVPAKRLFDLLVANRLGDFEMPYDDVQGIPDDVLESDNLLVGGAASIADDLQAIHFPIAFPEVFLRDRPGFDCIVGNPPWDKVRFEEQSFWVVRDPGLNNLTPSGRDARIAELRAGRPLEADAEAREEAERERLQEYFGTAYGLQGTGHLEYAKLFLERALSLSTSAGALGLVLPRQSLVLGGWKRLREVLIEGAEVKTFQARNKAGWLFDDVHRSYMVVLLCRLPSRAVPGVWVWGAALSLTDLRRTETEAGLFLSTEDLDALSDSHVVPWLNSLNDLAVFDKIRISHSLSAGMGWIEGSHDARWDFRGSGPDRRFAADTSEDASWPILMTRHIDAYGFNQSHSFRRFVRNPRDLVALGRGVALGESSVVLGSSHPTVVFRHPSRSEDRRTIIATALPRAGLLHNKGYVHAVRHSDQPDLEGQLALLGFMNTYVCDWWCRRFVDRHVTAPVINNLRLPDWSSEDVDLASRCASELLARRGMTDLPGDGTVELDPRFVSDTDDELVERLEVLAWRGFGFTASDVGIILDDFSDRGCGPAMRARLMERANASL